ncbi:MAG TPA: selenocysteine-specific translation elongation factor [Azospirillum sp.]|nr:selenocysteine-specific translation elongation factor [Azospirillum sp.]
MRTAVVGVIGHVDHGKTALVGALTGIDTDRLAEEKRRGISIALGFAHRSSAGGTLAFVDMPGHERFVRTMIAGATGIDAVLLVVAANEGIKPQTVEHLDIARLIGVARGVVAVSKCDLVGEDDARRTAAEVGRLLAGGPLAGARVVFTSAATGQGMAALADALDGLLAADKERADSGVFCLPVDRAFAVAGFGPVVTGTLRRGAIRVGDAVELWPGGAPARVRGLQAHGEPVEAAGPGSRVAVNLRGVELAGLPRGCILATPGLVAPGRWLDVRLELLGSAPRPLETGQAAQLLFGTTDVAARIRLLDRDSLEPGEAAPAQLHCAEPVGVPAGEPFILRHGSPARTVCGGRIVDPASVRRRRFDPAVADSILALAEGRVGDAVTERLSAAGCRGVRAGDLARLLGTTADRLDPAAWGAERLDGGTLVAASVYRDVREAALAAVADAQRASPTERGVSADRLYAALPDALPKGMADALVARLVAQGDLVRDGALLRRRGLDAAALLSAADRDVLAAVESAFRRGGLAPPDVSEVAGRDARRHKALHYLARNGVLVRALDRVQKREIVFHRDAVADAARRVADALAGAPEGLTVSDLGRLLGISRKFSVPLLEHLDGSGVTRRKGDRRVAGQPHPGSGPAAPQTPSEGAWRR